MAFKLIGAVLALVSLISGLPMEYPKYNAAPVLAKSHTSTAVKAAPAHRQVEYHNEAPAEYNFSYAVHDEQTGDIKSQQESRKGNAVQGRYEMIDADGHRRIVEYTADEHTGFNAVVHREPLVGKVTSPVVAPQPENLIAPYTAPIEKVSYKSTSKNLPYAATPVQHHKPIAPNFF